MSNVYVVCSCESEHRGLRVQDGLPLAVFTYRDDAVKYIVELCALADGREPDELCIHELDMDVEVDKVAVPVYRGTITRDGKITLERTMRMENYYTHVVYRDAVVSHGDNGALIAEAGLASYVITALRQEIVKHVSAQASDNADAILENEA